MVFWFSNGCVSPKKKKRSSNGCHTVTALGTQLILIVVSHDSWPNSYLKGIKDVFRSAYISANGSATELQPLLGQMWETRSFENPPQAAPYIKWTEKFNNYAKRMPYFLFAGWVGLLQWAKCLAFFTQKKKNSSVNVIG